MSAPEDLKDLYVEELKDLYSANDQMQRTVKKLVSRAKDEQLVELLNRSIEGIAEHTATLKSLIEAQEGKVSKEHCKGMEGLVEEANKHTSGEEAPKKGPVRDAQIIAQYQRMSHYGLAGFGTAAAYAKALGLKNDTKALKQITKGIYLGDEFGNRLAETSVNLQARDEG
jgi:ferritin-like metal-binding protein YciE